MNNDNEKRSVGRPFKMKGFIDVFKEVLEEENSLFITEKDLLFLANKKLKKKDRITLRTFQNWKAGEFHQDEETGEEFLELVDEMLIRQKQYLGKMMLDTNNSSWTKYAWALERKFDEFNLKHVSERINKNENTNIIQITASNEKQRALIDNLINGDVQTVHYQDVPHLKLKDSFSNDDNVKEDDYEF